MRLFDEKTKEKKLPIAGQMVANADPDKVSRFMVSFFGSKDKEDEKQKRLEAMKRRMHGG